MRVAYHEGPPEVTFHGIRWQRDVPQTVTPAQWAGMLARPDIKEFDFKVSPAPKPANEKE